uniref:Protein Wnt n=1 Tax=Hydra vulgaris TaxID=6087 RepID=B9WZC6_HYDVU|nr:secreted signaling factor Wnt2 [Hydra vulgaris]
MLTRLSSQVFSTERTNNCNNMVGFTKEQIELCKKYPLLMNVIGKGAHKALVECQEQFSFHKWNCSHTDQKKRMLLGKLTSQGGGKLHFFRAITSAGVTDEIIRACNMDKYSDACQCEHVPNNINEKLKWYGCNDNIKFGTMFAHRFLDAKEKGADASGLMNKQNNLAGQMAVKQLTLLICICHCVSGACSMKTCRHSISPFNQVGNFLQKKYHSAIHTYFDQNKNELVPVNHGVSEHTKYDLVYLETSLNYCIKNNHKGILGVAGRQCNKASYGPDGCDSMWCGMGFHTKKGYVESNCNCKFHWCCSVKCERCISNVNYFYCRDQTKNQKKKRKNKE